MKRFLRRWISGPETGELGVSWYERYGTGLDAQFVVFSISSRSWDWPAPMVTARAGVEREVESGAGAGLG